MTDANWKRVLVVAVVGLVAVPVSAAAQEAPRTAWGDPDLQGVWDFRTLTPLERPEELGDKAFLTAEEATEREQAEFDRNLRLWEQTPRTAVAGDNVGGYNNFWMDRGTTVIETRRTSLVIDPPNGRLPELTEEGQARAQIPLGSFTVEFPESYTDLSTYDRCIQGFNAGPPITPAAYNQNVQVFQTPQHVVLRTEMVHTARVIPLDGQPASRRPRAAVVRRFAGTLGRRHAGGGDAELRGEARLARVERQDDAGRALPPAGRGHPGVRIHRDGPRHVAGALDGQPADAEERSAAVRVCLPRRELRDAEHTRRRPRPGAADGRPVGVCAAG